MIKLKDKNHELALLSTLFSEKDNEMTSLGKGGFPGTWLEVSTPAPSGWRDSLHHCRTKVPSCGPINGLSPELIIGSSILMEKSS